jgi:hypothetical protein
MTELRAALWARLKSRRVAERYRRDERRWRKSAGQRLVLAHERSCRQRIALALRCIGVFPMTHHVERVAVLEKTGSDPETERNRLSTSTSEVGPMAHFAVDTAQRAG